MRNYKHLVFAGTFDRLHIGHKKLLDMAFELAEKVSIGITTENLYKSKPLANLIPTEAVRRRLVEQYLRQRNWLKRAKFFRLDDIYGPSIVDREMDSILVTEWTKANAEKINEIRVRRYLKPLRIIVAPLVRGDDGEVITSERIRLGEIDREGHLYQINEYTNKQISNEKKEELILPKYLRTELRKPLGTLIKSQIPNPNDQMVRQAHHPEQSRGTNPKSQIPNYKILTATAREVVKSIKSIKPKVSVVIAVGDIVTMSLLEVGFYPSISVVDLRSRRKPIKKWEISKLLPSHYDRNKMVTMEVRNEAGTLNLQTVKKIQISVKGFLDKNSRYLIKVNGEEDLLALPAMLFAPLQSVVLYGQIDLGVIVVEVTEEKKKEVERILSKFG